MECVTPLLNSRSSCHGNGYVCSVPDLGCICDVGWTSVGDFSLDSPGSACLINYGGVRIMGYLCIIFPVICNSLIIWHYISLARRKRSCYVINREYKTLFPLFFFMMGVSVNLYGILKISYPDGQQPLVGRDLSMSLVNFSCNVFCFMGLTTYLNVIIHFLHGYSSMITLESKQRLSKKLKTIGFYSWFIIPAIIIAGILPLIAIAHPSQRRRLCIAYFIGLFCVGFSFTLMFCNCLSYLLKELNTYLLLNTEQGSSMSFSNDIKKVIFRLKAAYLIGAGPFFIVSILLLVFGCSNLLFHLTTYYILILYACFSLLTSVLVMTVARISQSDDKQIVPIIERYNMIDQHLKNTVFFPPRSELPPDEDTVDKLDEVKH